MQFIFNITMSFQNKDSSTNHLKRPQECFAQGLFKVNPCLKKLCQYCNEEEARRGVLDRKEREQGKCNVKCKTVSLLFIVLKCSMLCTDYFGGKSVQFKHVTMRQMEMRNEATQNIS